MNPQAFEHYLEAIRKAYLDHNDRLALQLLDQLRTLFSTHVKAVEGDPHLQLHDEKLHEPKQQGILDEMNYQHEKITELLKNVSSKKKGARNPNHWIPRIQFRFHCHRLIESLFFSNR